MSWRCLFDDEFMTVTDIDTFLQAVQVSVVPDDTAVDAIDGSRTLLSVSMVVMPSVSSMKTTFSVFAPLASGVLR